MILLEEIAQLYCVLSFLESTLVVADLLSGLSSDVRTILGLSELEGLVVVWAYTILVRPKHPDERSIASLLSLVFPAEVVNLNHDFLLYSLVDVLGNSFSELINKILLALLLIIDGGLLKIIDNPLVIRWSDLDIELDEFLDLLLGDLIVLVLEAPVFLGCVLLFAVYWVKVPHVVLGHNATP